MKNFQNAACHMPEMQTATTETTNFSKLRRSYHAGMIHMKGKYFGTKLIRQKFFLTNFEKKAFRVFNFEDYVTPHPPK